jgi:hypothetical protein
VLLKAMKDCVSWLNWRTAAIVALVAVGVVLCTGLPSLGVLAGVAPVLLLVACLVPCLAPLWLLRKKGGQAQTLDTIRLTQQDGQGASTCGCGGDACRVGGPEASRSEGAAEAAHS